MQYFMIFEPSARKKLGTLPQKDQEKIKKVLESLQKNPYSGKKLSGELMGLYSVRAWPYRVIYTILKKELVVLVVAVAHRKDAYR